MFSINVLSHHSFRRSRLRLAAWYTGVMTLILMVGSYAIYRLVVHARWLHLERDMQSMAIAIERQVQPLLTTPGRFAPGLEERLPGACVANQPCPTASLPPQTLTALQTQLSTLLLQTTDDYCIRFVNAAKQPVATLSLPLNNPACTDGQIWDDCSPCDTGHYYHRKRYRLQTVGQEPWGTLQVARSLDQLDWYLWYVEITLLGLLLLAIGLVGYASWLLAGMAMQPLQTSYEQMQQFTADAAHELRTPVAAMRAMVQTALRAPETLTPEEVALALQTVDRQSLRLTQLLQDLLVLSRLDQESTTAHTLCDLSTLLKDWVEDCQGIAHAAQIQLTVEMPAQFPVQVMGHPNQLQRAVTNLLTNAIQYTPPHGQVTVGLGVEAGHYALIQVCDTGVGIDPSAQAKIFDRFYRVDKERSRHLGGAGLGLAIVRAIAQAHQGTVQVASKPGHGSTFTLRLPLAIAA